MSNGEEKIREYGLLTLLRWRNDRGSDCARLHIKLKVIADIVENELLFYVVIKVMNWSLHNPHYKWKANDYLYTCLLLLLKYLESSASMLNLLFGLK